MPDDNLPTLYTQPGCRWYYYSWYRDGVRVRESCRLYGLHTGIPHDEALRHLTVRLGIAPAPPAPGAETLGWFLSRLREQGDPNVDKKTWRLYLSDFALFVKFLGDDFPLSAVRRIPYVTQFQDWLSAHTARGPVTINTTCRSCQAIFMRAVRRGFLERNPFERFAPRREPEKLKFLTDPQLEKFLAVVRAWQPPKFRKKPMKFYDAIKRLPVIYLYLVRRRVEVLSIRRDDIDLTRNIIRLYLKKKRRRYEEIYEIPDDIRAEIAWFLANYRGDFPFRICHPNTVTKYFRMWFDLAGLPADLHQHSFRHTAIDLLVNAPNADIRAAQGLAGHATLAMTMKYVHSQPRGAARFEKNYNLPSLSPESENEKYDTKK